MYKLIHRIIIISCLFYSIALGSSTAGSFSENPISVKSIALGGCSAALLDTSGVYKNPAIIKINNQHALNTMHGKLFSDINYFNITYVRPEFTNYKFGFGFSFLNNSVAGIEETTYDNSTGAAEYTGKKLSYSASAYVFSFGNKLNDQFFYGSNLKIFQEAMAGANSSGVGADAGMIYKFNDKLLIGFSAINLIKPALRWSTGSSDQVNTRFSTGLAYKYSSAINMYMDIEKVENRQAFIHGGLEYKPLEFIAFRAGYDRSRLTVGTGFSYNNIAIDYAYVNNKEEDLGITQYIAASYIFGDNKDLEKIEADSENQKNLQAAITEEQLQAALKKLEVPIPETVTTETAEILPLPAPISSTANEELRPTLNSASENIQEKLEPVLPVVPEGSDTTEVVVEIEEEYKEPVHDYNIALLSARYYKNSKKLILKVFIDNNGNQNDIITCNAKIYNSAGATLQSFAAQETLLKDKETHVFYFTFDGALEAGSYYIETETRSLYSTKYQKEKFISRKN